MEKEMTLEDAINEAIKEVAPEEDNATEVTEDEDLVDLESTEDSSEDEEGEDLEASDDSEAEEVEESEEPDTNDFIVKVDGEEYKVTLDELKSGYSRQAHYTKSMQSLKEERESFQKEISQYQETLEQLSSLDTAWESNPVSVLTNLLSSTENPSYFLGLVIKEAAANDLLTPEALQYFGIDRETKNVWAQETEMDRLKKQLAEREDVERLRQEQELDKIQESKVKDAIQVYDNQITDIIQTEGLDLPTVRDRQEFKVSILTYANENGILDLKKAYAAMMYENSRAKGKVANPKKQATKVVSRKSAGGSSVSQVSNPKDLRSLIQDTMKDIDF
jgi:hypothetical protein